LDLLDSIKVHPIFYPEKLCLVSSLELLEGQVLTPQPPVQVNNKDKWEVKQVLAVRL
jgi:hypothetical protein